MAENLREIAKNCGKLRTCKNCETLGKSTPPPGKLWRLQSGWWALNGRCGWCGANCRPDGQGAGHPLQAHPLRRGGVWRRGQQCLRLVAVTVRRAGVRVWSGGGEGGRSREDRDGGQKRRGPRAVPATGHRCTCTTGTVRHETVQSEGQREKLFRGMSETSFAAVERPRQEVRVRCHCAGALRTVFRLVHASSFTDGPLPRGTPQST